MANVCGKDPTLTTVRLTMSEIVSISVGPGEVKLVGERPKPNVLFEISPMYNRMLAVGVHLETSNGADRGG
jgi:hypothetical protein